MMNCIVPLAGPDFVHPELGIKPLFLIEGSPLLQKVIHSRPWWQQGLLQSSGLIFVLRDIPESYQLLPNIKDWFPGSKTVILSKLTIGALSSALAGVSLIEDLSKSLCIDLVDILYQSSSVIADKFSDIEVGAIVPYFSSQQPCYSYLSFDDQGLVKRAVEKEVISSNASAGTYFFRDAATFTEAVSYSFQRKEELSFRDNLFVCPAVNSVIAANKKVIPVPVDEVRAVSKLFH